LETPFGGLRGNVHLTTILKIEGTVAHARQCAVGSTENAGPENAGPENAAGPLTLALKKKLKKFAMHRLATFMLSDVAVVRNVPLKSAKHAQFRHRFN